MGSGEGVGNLGSPHGDLLDWPGNAREGAERLAPDQFGDKRRTGFEAENIMDSDQVRMIEGRCSLSFAYQTFAGRG